MRTDMSIEAEESDGSIRDSMRSSTSKRGCAGVLVYSCLNMKCRGILLSGLLAIHCGGFAGAQAAPMRDMATVSAPWFSDVGGRSAIHYVTSNGYSGRKYFPQPMCGGVAAFDFDNDGKIDLFFTNGSPLPDLTKSSPLFYNALYRNLGNGTFEDVTQKAGLAGEHIGYSFGVAVGDYDNDGHEDIFIAGAERNTLSQM